MVAIMREASQLTSKLQLKSWKGVHNQLWRASSRTGQLRTETKHKRKPLCHRRRAPRAGEGLAPQFPWLIGCYVFHRGPLKKLRKVIDCHTQSSAIGS
jgi:hypothetical protein